MNQSVAKKKSGLKTQSSTNVSRGGRWIAAALVLCTLAVYGQVVTHQFISLDDDLYIQDNPMVANGLTLKGIAWAFTTFYAANWHPLTWLSHMIDSQLFGLNAGGHLLVNALIHVANTLILFVFLKRVTGAMWPTAIVAALFALHPLHVESVAWAAERKDTLSTFFGLLSLLAYVRYARAPSWRHFLLVALTLGLGLMAKPMLVTWPFLMLLLDYWPLQRVKWQPADGIKRFVRDLWPLIREKIPLYCLVAASMAVTYIAQAHGGSVRGIVDEPLSWRLSNAAVSYAKYLLLTIWPHDLAVYYPFYAGVPVGQIVASLIVLIAVTAVAIWQARARPYLFVGWLWFLGTLVPVIGLVQVGGQSMADRYFYIPSIGLFVALVFLIVDLARAWRISRGPIAICAAIVLLLCGSVTAKQVARWRDSVTLFEHTLSVTSDNFVVQNNLGHVLALQGKYDEAVPHFTEALRLNPSYLNALLDMGLTLAKQGKPAEASVYYRRALNVDPKSAKAHMQLALVLVEQKKGEPALQEFDKARELAPNDADIRTNLGLMLARLGKLPEAIAELNQALRINPNSAEAHNNLGLVLLASGKPEESLKHFTTALRLKPNLTVAHDNLLRAQTQIRAGQR